jgi:hypothetical protein
MNGICANARGWLAGTARPDHTLAFALLGHEWSRVPPALNGIAAAVAPPIRLRIEKALQDGRSVDNAPNPACPSGRSSRLAGR